MGTCGEINAIWWNIKINLQKSVGTCGYELPTNLPNFTQKELTEVERFQNVLEGYFLKHPVYSVSTKNEANYFLAQRHQTATKRSIFGTEI